MFCPRAKTYRLLSIVFYHLTHTVMGRGGSKLGDEEYTTYWRRSTGIGCVGITLRPLLPLEVETYAG